MGEGHTVEGGLRGGVGRQRLCQALRYVDFARLGIELKVDADLIARFDTAPVRTSRLRPTRNSPPNRATLVCQV